jgi:hypothetical protein
MNPVDIFKQHVGEVIDKFAADRKRHKKLALRLKVSTSLLGALATVFLGWEAPGDFAPYLKNAALTATALITVLAAYDAFFEPRKLWVRETLVLNSLQDLRREFQIVTAIDAGATSEVARFSERFHEILGKSLSDWVKDKQIG